MIVYYEYEFNKVNIFFFVSLWCIYYVFILCYWYVNLWDDCFKEINILIKVKIVFVYLFCFKEYLFVIG